MRPSYEEVHRLVLKMREGSKEARRELIEAHVGLAFKAAQKYDDDEALSDALFTLVDEVGKFQGHPAALPSYLKVALGRAAASSWRERRGPRNAPHNRHCAANDAKRFMHSGRGLPHLDPFTQVDLMDQILAACETVEEKKMVYYKSLSMTYAEVALRLGTSATHVARSMQRLALRFGVQERLRA